MREDGHRGRLLPHLLYALLARPSCSDLQPTSTTKIMYGTPVYNYDKAFSYQGTMDAEGKKQEWILMLRGGDKEVHKVCVELKGACKGEGHPDGGGVPFAAMEATAEELEAFVSTHTDDIEFVEPSMPIFMEPAKGEGVTKAEVALAPFGSNRKPDEKLLQVGQEAGYYCICLTRQHKLQGWGPFPTRNQADNQFSKVIQQCNTIVVTPVATFKIERGQGSTNDSRIKKWWTCKTTGKDCDGVPPTNPTPSPGGGNPFPPRPTPGPAPGPAPPGSNPTNRWGLDRIDQRTGRDNSFTGPKGLDGKGVHVYVLDTGIRATHEDYGGRVVPTIETHTKQIKECDPADVACATDTYGHGSHCAGTIGGKVSGVAPGVTLHAVKVMTKGGRASDGSTFRNLLAIDWVAKNAIKPALMSMSLGGDGQSASMNRSVNLAHQAGILSVVAAGNIGNGQVKDGQACSQTPAHIKVAYTVAASTATDGRARYSNYGECTDIWAPGDRILSTMHQSDTAYDVMSGTSMACPHVSGAAALMLQKYPSASPDEISEGLTKYATPDAISSPGAGTPNLLLFVTDYELDIKPTTPPAPFTRRRSGGTKPTRRRSGGTTRRRSSKPTRRRSSRRRKSGTTRRRKGTSRRRKR